MTISYAYQFWALHLHSTPSEVASLAGGWLPGYLYLFALGMFLAVISAWWIETKNAPTWVAGPIVPWISWACAAGAFFWVCHIGLPDQPFGISTASQTMLRGTLYGAFALFLLLPTVFGPQDEGLIRRALQLWPFTSLGVISYGIYLWHVGCIVEFLRWSGDTEGKTTFWILTLAVLSMSIVAASVSYFVLERPLLRMKGRLAWWNRSEGRPGGRLSRSTPRVEIDGYGPVGEIRDSSTVRADHRADLS